MPNTRPTSSRPRRCSCRPMPTDANQVVFYDEGVGIGAGRLRADDQRPARRCVRRRPDEQHPERLSVSRLQLLAPATRFSCSDIPAVPSARAHSGACCEPAGSEQGVHKQGRGGRCHLQEPGPQAWCRCARVHQVPPRLQCRLLPELRQCRAGHPPSAHGRIHGRLGNRWLSRRSVHSLFASLFNRKYQFHDLALSRMVKSARHALAIDEKRRTFVATPWKNIDDLNRHAGRADVPAAEQPYLQQWFPGDHATVGGGGDVNGLWEASLVWVVEGGNAAGLPSTRLPWTPIATTSSTTCPCIA